MSDPNTPQVDDHILPGPAEAYTATVVNTAEPLLAVTNALNAAIAEMDLPPDVTPEAIITTMGALLREALESREHMRNGRVGPLHVLRYLLGLDAATRLGTPGAEVFFSVDGQLAEGILLLARKRHGDIGALIDEILTLGLLTYNSRNACDGGEA